MESDAPSALITGKALWFLWIYLGSMVVVGIIGRFARREDSMSDFYLTDAGWDFSFSF